jgi:hypothetical protein
MTSNPSSRASTLRAAAIETSKTGRVDRVINRSASDNGTGRLMTRTSGRKQRPALPPVRNAR